MTPAAATSHGAARLVGVDTARCLALVGMIATHVLASRDPDGSLSVSEAIAGGRASALFAVLAGVSMALVSGRRTPVRGRRRVRVSVGLAARAVLVGALGLWLGGLDTGIAVILTYYAVLFLLGLPFLGLGPRTLLALAAGWAVAAPVLSQLVRPDLPARQYASPDLDQASHPGHLLAELLITGYYPAVPWLTYLLLGLALGRLDLGSRQVAAALATAGAAVAVAASVVSHALTASRFTAAELDDMASGLYGQTPVDGPGAGWRWLLVVAPHSTTPFDLAQTAGSAACVIGLCLLLADRLTALGRRPATTLRLLSGAGAMTLSLYTLHLVMKTPRVWPAEEPDSFGWHLLVVLGTGAVFAVVRRRGPLEWLVGLTMPRSRSARGVRVTTSG